MRMIKFSPMTRALAACIGTLAFAGAGHAAGDKAAYEGAKASAKSAYEAAKAKCDALKDNAKDICVAQAKAARTRTDEQAEAAYKGTPKAREQAIREIAEADYKVARERCDDRIGNDRDVCIKVAKAALVKANPMPRRRASRPTPGWTRRRTSARPTTRSPPRNATR